MTGTESDPADVSDEEIVAFLDGHLGPERDAEIALKTAENPELAARIEALSLDKDRLAAGMSELLVQAPPIPIPMAEKPVSAAPGRYWIAAAALLAFAIGIGAGGFAFRDQAPAGWHQAVAHYQALYTAETVTGAPINAETRTAGLNLVNARLDLNLTLDRLALTGMKFQRAQMLEFDGAPLAQFVFLDDAQNPIAFCVMAATEMASPTRTERISGLNAVHWSDEEHKYIVIGPADQATIDRLTDALQGMLNS